jgi:hypothetical protein
MQTKLFKVKPIDMNEEREYLIGDPGDEQPTTTTGVGTSTENGNGETQSSGSSVQEVSSNADSNGQTNPQAQAQVPSPMTDEQKTEVVQQYVDAAVADDLLAFNSLRIKRVYPKAYRDLTDYMVQRAQLPTDDDTVVGVLLYTPRNVLYEFFDRRNLFLNVGGNNTSWHFNINGEPSKLGFKSRVAAEYAGFEEAFYKFEHKDD